MQLVMSGEVGDMNDANDDEGTRDIGFVNNIAVSGCSENEK